MGILGQDPGASSPFTISHAAPLPPNNAPPNPPNSPAPPVLWPVPPQATI